MTVPPQSVSAASPDGAPKLKRSMGLWMATALVVGNMVGSGVFLLPATLAGTAGPISMLGWLFTGAGAVLLALVFANLGRALPRQGGPYAFSAAAQAWLWLVERETFQPLHLVRDVVIATLAFAYSLWAIAGAGDDIVTKGFILLLAGIPVYIGMRWWERRKLEHVTLPEPEPGKVIAGAR
jgi:L-asparagine transporter-like permease